MTESARCADPPAVSDRNGTVALWTPQFQPQQP